MGKSIPNREDSKCQSPKAGSCQVCVRDNQEHSVIGAEGGGVLGGMVRRAKGEVEKSYWTL